MGRRISLRSYGGAQVPALQLSFSLHPLQHKRPERTGCPGHFGVQPAGEINVLPELRAVDVPQDAAFLAFSGMQDVRVVEERFTYGDAEVIKVNAVHGTIKPCCDAAGFVFRAPREKTVYLCGDTVWCDDAKGLKKRGLLGRVHIPADGETYEI